MEHCLGKKELKELLKKVVFVSVALISKVLRCIIIGNLGQLDYYRSNPLMIDEGVIVAPLKCVSLFI